jgi:ATP-dependent DNA helicase RecG
MNLRPSDHITALPGVGQTIAKRLGLLGIQTVRDILFHLPFRYDDLRLTKPLHAVRDGERVTVKGSIEHIAAKRSPRKRLLVTEAIITDTTDRLRVVWFGQPFIAKTLAVGDEVFLGGTIVSDRLGLVLQNPAFEKVKKESPTQTARLLPVYGITHGLTQKQMRLVVGSALSAKAHIPEPLPEKILQEAKVLPLSTALQYIHAPENPAQAEEGLKRLKFDELFLLQLRAVEARRAAARQVASVLPFPEIEVKTFVDALPYVLTKDQKISSWEIIQDIGKEVPMNRLLQGDVGSGKTVVAAIALLVAARGGAQAALMAPTDILAKQHADSLKDMFHNMLRLGLYTRTTCEVWGIDLEGKSQAAKRRSFLEKLKKGEIDVVVGTHALLTEKVVFRNLALTVVDEQHRFGVTQRRLLKDASRGMSASHFLSMTATPIPRTLALAVYGDLDLSFLREKPADRKPIVTKVVEPNKRDAAYAFLRQEIDKGHQVFVICPMIEDAEGGSLSEKKTVLQEYEKLKKQVFPDKRVGYVHGKMPVLEKDTVMEQFRGKELDVLVATSVIEVGVNIPNATVMMIEGAEFFGLAQLHQFRGRVGRSGLQSYCFLFPNDPSKKAMDRLTLFASTNDGFRLAEYDLEERGPGEVYGTSQSGLMELRLATLRDADLLLKAKTLASQVSAEEFPELFSMLSLWRQRVHLE